MLIYEPRDPDFDEPLYRLPHYRHHQLEACVGVLGLMFLLVAVLLFANGVG